MRKLRFGFCLIVAVFLANNIAQERFPWEDPCQWDVPYVPTPLEVVDRMLAMADVTGHDVLFDLGCGDGRIVIRAASFFGTKGTGIDIDPERIEECKINAADAKVEKKVTFLNQDLFETDFSQGLCGYFVSLELRQFGLCALNFSRTLNPARASFPTILEWETGKRIKGKRCAPTAEFISFIFGSFPPMQLANGHLNPAQSLQGKYKDWTFIKTSKNSTEGELNDQNGVSAGRSNGRS